MEISAKKFNSGAVVYLKTDLSVDSVQSFHETVEPFLAEKIKNLVFDFDGVDYICSAGLGIIANAFKKISQNGGKVYVTSISERIEKILKATTLDQFVIIRDDSEKLVESLGE